MDSIPDMDHHNHICLNTSTGNNPVITTSSPSSSSSSSSSRYENQKRRDWNTFGQYLKNHRPPLSLSRCSGAHVLEFLRYLDQFGKTKHSIMMFAKINWGEVLKKKNLNYFQWVRRGINI
ncbi:hypothetical protein ACFE04_031782 [Oxalis oulophora]